MNFKPVGDSILVEELPEKIGNLYIPDAARRFTKAKVLDVGPGSRNFDGDSIEPCVKIGDCVVYHKGAARDITIDGKSFLIIKEADLLGIIEE